MSRPTLSVIGAGQVGATVAHLALLKQLADVVLIDVVDGLAAGKALDLLQAAAVESLDVQVSGTTDFDAMAGSRIVVVTAGLARKPGMSRDDLQAANANIVGPVAERIARVAPEAIVIIVTNPLDVMTHLALTRTKFPRQRVLGMAGVLDSGRFRAFAAQELKVSPAGISALVLGSHGDLMVPVAGSVSVDGQPIASRLKPDAMARLVKRTRDGGAEIVSLLKTGSAYYAPASSVIQMVQAILHDEHRVLPAAVKLEGEYGLRDVCIGVPVEIASRGAERIIEVSLSAEDRQALHAAAKQVSAAITQLSAPPAPATAKT